MSEYGDTVADGRDDPFDSERRGYNRRQVDEYIAMRNSHVRQLENRLSQSIGEIERLRRELAEAREAVQRPAHEEIPERVGQILKLAAEQATADRKKVTAEIAELRESARQETDKLRADTKLEAEQGLAQAHDQAERLYLAAKEEAERSVAAAKAESEHLVSTAQATAERTISEATNHAESTVASAMAHAKQQLDEATARASAVHDGAERRLNLLISRHTETVRRLTEIRDVVTSLVAGEAARGSLDDEVARALGHAGPGHAGPGHAGPGHAGPSHAGPDARGQAQHDPLAVGAHRAGRAVPAGRAPAGGRTVVARELDRPDPLSVERADQRPDNAHSVRQPDVAHNGGDGRPEVADDARDNTDDLTEATDNVRHPGNVTMRAGSARGSDLVLDDAAGAPRGIEG